MIDDKTCYVFIFCLVYGLINKICPGGWIKYVCVMSKSKMAANGWMTSKSDKVYRLKFVNRLSEVDDKFMNIKCV